MIAAANVGWIVLATALLTVVVMLVIDNFVGAEQRIDRKVERLYSLEDPRFVQELGVLLGPPVVGGNRIRLLRNGDEIFPAMLAAIRGAQRSVTFETYIYWSGDIGRAFADALSERARAGVGVHVLLDWVGSAKMDRHLLEQLTASGVEVCKFHAPRWYQLDRLNNRTHRKLLVIDGRLGYTGGVGIAPTWTGHAQDPDHWRDDHFEVTGPVVAQMQAVFIDNWIKVSGDVLHGEAYFPALTDDGPSSAQMFSASPEGGGDSMELMYLLSITAASTSIELAAAYFVPGRLALGALVEAMRRGVRLRIITPGVHIDSAAVRRASRAEWGDLLLGGALIAEYQPTMYHCKAMVVDGLLTSVGSTNFDNRSLRLNDEATLNVVDAEFARALTAAFEADLLKARVVSYDDWHRRPWTERMAEKAGGWFSSQL